MSRYVSIEKNSINEIPIYAMLLGMLMIQIGSPIQVEVIMSLGVWVIFIASLLAFVVAIRRTTPDKYLFVFIVLVLTLMISLVRSLDFSYNNLVVMFGFLEIPIFMLAYPKINSGRVKKVLYVCFFVLSVYYIILSFTSLSHVYYTDYGKRYMEFLTLGLNNPNETAMCLFACFVVIFSMFFEIRSSVLKLVVFADAIMVARLIWLTMSRTGIIMSAAIVVIALLFRKKKIPVVLRVIAFGSSIVFLVVTLLLEQTLDTLFVLGDIFNTGRSNIYERVLNSLDFLSFFVGRYEYRFENLHNAFWSIFATIGLFGVGAYYWFITSKVRDIHFYAASSQKTRKFAYVGLLLIFIYTATEAAFLVSGGSFAAMVTSIYILSVFEKEKNAPEELLQEA